MANTIAIPDVRKCCPWYAVTPATMRASPATLKAGIAFIASRYDGFFAKNKFINAPPKTGRIVTIRMLLNIPAASTSTISPLSQSISIGVISGAKRVLAVVIPTLSATSPFAR